MTGNEYQKFANRTCSITENKTDMLHHAGFGLTSEAGEVAFDIDHFKKELGDCTWMIAEAVYCGRNNS